MLCRRACPNDLPIAQAIRALLIIAIPILGRLHILSYSRVTITGVSPWLKSVPRASHYSPVRVMYKRRGIAYEKHGSVDDFSCTIMA